MVRLERSIDVASATDDRVEQIDRLEDVLRLLLEGYVRLLRSLQRKKEAIRIADMKQVTQTCAEERRVVHRLGELDKQRLEIVFRLTQWIDPEAQSPLPMSRLLEITSDSKAQCLLALAGQLRERMKEVQHASSVVRTAAEALTGHLSGLIQTVQTAVSQVKTYGHRGCIAPGTQMRHSVDLKS